MDGLPTEQHELLRRHREAALDLVLVVASAYTGSTPLRDLPAGRALLREPPERLVPVAVSAAAAAVERRRFQQDAADSDRSYAFDSADSFPIEVLHALGRRRLPFAAEDVELLLDLGSTTMRPDRVLGRVLEIVLTALVLLALPLALGSQPASAASALPSVRVVGQPQPVFDWGESACEPMNYPDLPARAFRDFEGGVQLLISHFDNFRLIGPSLDRLAIDCDPVLLSHRSAAPRRFQDREWIASIFTRDGKNVWALVHEEYQGNRHRGRCPSHRYYRCWYNAITLAHSSDGGRTYTQAAPPRNLVAAAPYRYRPDRGPAGVFTPSNIVSGPDGAFYVLVRVRDPGRERGTCLLRSRHVGRPRSWRAWNGAGFTGRFRNPYRARPRGGIPCVPVGQGSIAEMAESLTYNTALGRYLLVGLAPPGANSIGPKARGIYFSTSPDLIHWSERRLVTRAVTTHNYACDGPSPLAYPSVIDPESGSPTFATSGAHPFLYYTQFRYRGCRQTAERDLMRVPLAVRP